MMFALARVIDINLVIGIVLARVIALALVIARKCCRCVLAAVPLMVIARTFSGSCCLSLLIC